MAGAGGQGSGGASLGSEVLAGIILFHSPPSWPGTSVIFYQPSEYHASLSPAFPRGPALAAYCKAPPSPSYTAGCPSTPPEQLLIQGVNPHIREPSQPNHKRRTHVTHTGDTPGALDSGDQRGLYHSAPQDILYIRLSFQIWDM